MKVQKRILTIVLILFALFILIQTTVYAQESDLVSYPDGAEVGVFDSDEVDEVQTEEFSGRVSRIDGRTLVVETEDAGVKSVEVPQNVRVTKNGTTAIFEDLKVNDEVRVTTNGDSVVSISATSSAVADISQYIIPIIIGLAILGIVAVILMQNKNKGRIKTETTKL